MDDMTAFERQVAGAMVQRAGPILPVDDAAVFATTTTSPRWRFQSMFSATKFVVAGVIVALFGGFLLSGVMPSDPGEQLAPAATPADATAAADPTTEATVGPEATQREATHGTITLPQELPVGSSRGTIETAAGRVEWIRLGGAGFRDDEPGGTLPRMAQLIPWDDGVAAWFSLWDSIMLASTTDGVVWHREEVPWTGSGRGDRGGSARVGVVEGTAYLVSPESGQVWARDADGGEWSELDASAIGEAMPGEGWKTRYPPRASEPAMAGDRVYFEVTERYRLPREKLGIPSTEATGWLTQLDKRRFALCSRRNCPGDDEKAKWRVRIDPTEAGLRVVNDRNGKVLGVIEGAKRSELYEGFSAEHTVGFAIDGSSVVRADAPGIDEAGSPASPQPPEGTAPWAGWAGLDWLARDTTDPWSGWMLVGEQWVSLDGVIPLGQDLHPARTGNVVAFSSDLVQDELDVWLLVLPEGA